ncbi:MAG TPA: IS66 family transposase [Kofleriaceae bacterium]|nr:IS66 family transposase [Kofleriaceae bacterium]
MDPRIERDIEQLRRIAITQKVQIEHLLTVLAAQSKRIDELTGGGGELQQALDLLEKLKEREAGDTTTHADAGDDEGEQGSESGDERKGRQPRSKSGPTAQPKLELEERVYTLDGPDTMCPCCGGELRPMEGHFDESEMIDLVDVEYRVVKVKQQKYSCRCGGCIETAPGPERAIRGGRYSLEFAIKVGISKYLDHLPLERQARIMDRYGLEITSQTLWDQIYALAERVRVIWQELFARVLRQPVIGLDQTSWKRLDGSKSTPWQMWCLTAPGVVYHRICNDKGAATFQELVGNYEGTIVCDALSTHAAGARASPGIVLAGCWAHVYRKFEEAAPNHPEALLALDWIGKLYEIDERAGDDLDARAELRRTESASVLELLKTWLWNQAALRTLSIGRAAAYAIANWDRLTRFVGDPRVPLDNNATERGIRGPVIGRRNHFGSKSQRGTEVAAIFYSLLETAKLHGVDPARYLVEAAKAAPLGEIIMPWELDAEAG